MNDQNGRARVRVLIVMAVGAVALSLAGPGGRLRAAAAQPAAAANPLVAAWPGPYDGVPPWEDAKPDNFPAALEAALDEQRREIAAIAADGSAPTFDNTIARHAARRAALRSRRPHVRCRARQHQHPGVPEARTRMDAEARRRVRCDLVQSRVVQADRGHLPVVAQIDAHGRAEAPGRAHLRWLRARRRQARRRREEADVRHQPGAGRAVHRLRQEGPRRREHLDRPRQRGGPRRPARIGRGRRRNGGGRPKARRQVGRRQHPLERRSVPDRRRRAATCARRSGRRSRTAATTATPTTPTRPSPRSSSCAPSARSCSATRRTRTGAWSTRWPTTREGARR